MLSPNRDGEVLRERVNEQVQLCLTNPLLLQSCLPHPRSPPQCEVAPVWSTVHPSIPPVAMRHLFRFMNANHEIIPKIHI